MDAKSTETQDLAPLLASIGPQMTEDEARRIFALGPDAVVFALMAQARMISELRNAGSGSIDPATPSAQIPVYSKPPRKGRGKPKGARPGHPGSRRETPVEIDRQQDHTLTTCPDCDSPVRERGNPRTRVIEDIPEGIKPVVTRHVIHGYWCRKCRKTVEPVVAEALPKSAIGLRTGVLSAWLHYQLGASLGQILDVFNFHLRMKLTGGGLVHIWNRIAEILRPWYDEIQETALASAVLNVDETGWRVNGETHWLWCFTTSDATYYLIDRSRGSPALKRFFRQEYEGVLITDFWNAYNAVTSAAKQRCLPHLLRDLKRTEKMKSPGDDWPEFRKRLKRLMRDSLRLGRRRTEIPPEDFSSKRARLDARLSKLIEEPWHDRECRRLVKRMRRHAGELFTFLDYDGVPADNNHAERQIRPAVLMRKTSYANGSEAGAETQAILMSVFRTLKLRGMNPTDAIVKALRFWLTTGDLPTLKSISTVDG